MLDRFFHAPLYTSTNESLRAITAGLDLNEEDRVLSICGSGDQAFAMLEFAYKVDAYDTDLIQVEFASDKFRLFFGLTEFELAWELGLRLEEARLNPYFKKILKELQEFLLREIICESHMETYFIFFRERASEYNKIYFSNSEGYYGFESRMAQALLIKQGFSDLPKNSLIYASRPLFDMGEFLDPDLSSKAFEILQEDRINYPQNDQNYFLHSQGALVYRKH